MKPLVDGVGVHIHLAVTGQRAFIVAPTGRYSDRIPFAIKPQSPTHLVSALLGVRVHFWSNPYHKFILGFRWQRLFVKQLVGGCVWNKPTPYENARHKIFHSTRRLRSTHC